MNTSSILEATLQRDIDRIRDRVLNMGALAENALKLCLQALLEKSRQKAYAVILRDQRIDESDEELDRLCLEFLVRQQPVASHLRFVYATIKVNAELERIGDYAESIARQVLKVASLEKLPALEKFTEIANLSIPMLHAAVEAFVKQDAELARRTMLIEERVDTLRSEINGLLLRAEHDGVFPVEHLTPLLTIVRRYERVSDQAKNICEEVLYMCTGEYAKHRGSQSLRILFVDEHNASSSLIAEGIGKSLGLSQLEFLSAGLDAKPADPRTVAFLKTRGIDVSQHQPQAASALAELSRVPVIVALTPAARSVFPPAPTKSVALDWSLPDPAAAQGSAADIEATYEQVFQQIRVQVQDLVQALLGEENQPSSKRS